MKFVCNICNERCIVTEGKDPMVCLATGGNEAVWEEHRCSIFKFSDETCLVCGDKCVVNIRDDIEKLKNVLVGSKEIYCHISSEDIRNLRHLRPGHAHIYRPQSSVFRGDECLICRRCRFCGKRCCGRVASLVTCRRCGGVVDGETVYKEGPGCTICRKLEAAAEELNATVDWREYKRYIKFKARTVEKRPCTIDDSYTIMKCKSDNSGESDRKETGDV